MFHHLKPHIKQIWHLLLNITMEVRDFERALSLAEKMVNIEPADEKIIASIALCHQHLNNYHPDTENTLEPELA